MQKRSAEEEADYGGKNFHSCQVRFVNNGSQRNIIFFIFLMLWILVLYRFFFLACQPGLAEGGSQIGIPPSASPG
jgi:hypothetical protein